MNGPFRGSLVALPTPFEKGEIDYPALLELVEFQVEHGSDGLVACGTTGEAATLTESERLSVVAFVVGAARRRVPVIAGVGTNDTWRSRQLAREAELAGADGVLAVVPYYNKPNQRGLLAHFGAIAAATKLPVMLYNIPARSGADLSPATVAELAERHRNVVAIKEASNSIPRAKELLALESIDVFCGEDHLIADFMQLGAAGVVGVVGNVLPREVHELVLAAAPGGDSVRAAALVERILPVARALFLETNPAPLKHALAWLGLCGSELRLPMVPLEPATAETLEAVLADAGLRHAG